MERNEVRDILLKTYGGSELKLIAFLSKEMQDMRPHLRSKATIKKVDRLLKNMEDRRLEIEKEEAQE